MRGVEARGRGRTDAWRCRTWRLKGVEMWLEGESEGQRWREWLGVGTRGVAWRGVAG